MNNEKIINNFLRYLKEKGVSPNSLKYYKSDIKNFFNWAGKRQISTSLVREYLDALKFVTPNSTLNRRLSTLRSYSQFVKNNFMTGVENVTNKPVTSVNQVPKTSAYRFIQERILNIFSKREKIQSLIYKTFFNRPNWYKRYHSYPLASYIHIAILILFTSITGYAIYDQVINTAKESLAFPTALTRPNRYLSFQGRLTDNLGNPKTVATNMVFKLYSVSSGGSALWDSTTCSITPDQDGIFSTLLGSSCGAEIASSVFSENAGIWLGVTVAADAEATPRIQIATVAYALNSETLQGFPAGTGTSTIPYIDSTGTVVLASSSPKIQSTSGTFAVEGQALTITTPNTSNGIITINPDGVGTLDLTFEGAAPGLSANGFLNATNANITSGALYGGTVASAATGYNFVDFQSGVSPTSKFSVDASGNTTMAGNLTVSGTSVVLPNNSIGPNEVLSTGQVDEYCLTYEATGTTWEWQACGAGGSSVWSDLTTPTANLSLAHAGYTTAFTFDSVTTADAFALSSSSLTTGTILDLSSTSTAGGASGLSKVLDITRSGTNANASHTAYGLYSAVTNTGTTSTNVGGYFSASGATNNYGLIVANGNVGIGTTGPGYKLDVNGYGSFTDRIYVQRTGGTGQYFKSNTDYTTQILRVADDSLAILGVGTLDAGVFRSNTGLTVDFDNNGSNPSSNFYVRQASNDSKRWLTVQGNTGNVGIGTAGPVYKLELSDASGSSLSLRRNDDTTTVNETIGQILFTGTDTVDTLVNAVGAKIMAVADTSWGTVSGNHPTRLEFYTEKESGGGIASPRMVIKSTGNVGIGTTGPDAKLDSLSTTEQLRLTYTDGSVYSAHTVDSSGNLTIDNTGTKTIIADDLQITGGDILDSNGNESIRFGTTASSVNEATLTNAATGGIVLFAATGGDTDIALSIDSKGADALNLNGTATGDVNIAGGSGSTGCTIANATGNLTCTGTISGTIVASSLPFSGLTSATNTTAAMVVGAGATLGYTSTGTIDASSLVGATWISPGTIGSTTPNTGAFTTLSSTALTTTGNATAVTANSLTTGNALNLSSTSTAGGASGVSKMLNISRSGVNAQLAHTAYGVYSDVTNTNATSGINIAGYFSASGATTANYGLLVANGSVGIGTINPGASLDVVGNILIQGGGIIDTRAAGSMTIGGTTQTGLTLGRAGATTTIAGSGLTISPTAWTATPTISGAVTMTSGFDSNGASTVAGLTVDTNGDLTVSNGILSVTAPSTTGNATAITANSLTTGNALNLSSTSTAGGASGLSKVLDIARSGTNANASHTAYGLYSAVTNTGTTSTNVGGYFSVSGATNNYGLIVENGNVGVGTTSPTSTLSVGATSQFQVNSTGNIVKINDVVTSFPASQGGAGTVLTNNGSGTLTWATGGGSSVWSALTTPTANLSLAMSTYTTGFNWATGTSTNDLFSLTSDASADGTGSILNIQSGTSSTLSPFRVRAGAIEAVFVKNDGNVGIGTTSPISKLHIATNLTTTTGKSALIIDQLENQDIFTASASGVTKMTLKNDGTLNLVNATSSISNTSGDITIDAASNNISFSGDDISSIGTVTAGTGIYTSKLQVAGSSAVAYSRFGLNTTGHGLTTGDDLLITKALELDGILYLDGGIIANSSGTAAVVLSGTPTTTSNTLTAGNWLVENTANVGQAALMVNNTKSGDLFTASASGTTKFVVTNAGNVGIGTNSPTAKLTINNLQTTDTLLYLKGVIGQTAPFVSIDDSSSNNLLSVDYQGKIGVGTTTPTNILSLGNTSSQKFWIENTASGTGGRSLTVAAGGTVAGGTNTTGGDLILQSGLGTGTGTSNISFQTGTTLATGTTLQTMSTKMTILGNGNVGIGAETPYAKLQINGNVVQSDGFNAVGDQGSMVPNAGFEINDGGNTAIGWTAGGSGTHTESLTSTSPAHGSWSATLQANATSNSSIIYTACFPITGGRTYGLYNSIKANTATTSGHSLRLSTFTTFANCSSITSATDYNAVNNAAVTTSYANAGTTITPASTQLWARVYVLNNNPNVTATFTVDSVRLTQSSLTVGLDLAENFPVDPNNIPQIGEIVILDESITNNIIPVKTADKSYDQNVIGIVSTQPGLTLDDGQDYPKVAIALAGRVPVKVSSENGNIKVGDYLTSSSIKGVAMKSTKSGRVVGKAMEAYQSTDPASVSSIIVFVNPTWFEPDIAINNQGDVLLAGNLVKGYSVTTPNGIVSKISAFASVTIAKLQVGFGSFKQIETSLISPVADTDLIIDLQPDDSRSATRLVIKGVNNEIVTSFDAEGNATISGTLYADKIESERLNKIEELLKEVETNQLLLTEATLWSANTATDSGDLIANSIQTKDLFVTGQAAVTSLFVSDNLTTKSIDSLDTSLKIQSLAASPLEIMAGRIIIDTSGNTKFLGNVEVAGDLKINNIIVASQEESLVASVSGEINTNATAGTAVLPAGLAELKIVNSKVKANSLIYITPISSTQNKVLYVKSKDVGIFTIGFNEAIDTDVEFNWWIIELQ